MKKLVFLTEIILFLVLCISSGSAVIVQENGLRGTWYCADAESCILVNETETQFYRLKNPKPWEDVAPDENGSTIIWRDTIGTYTYFRGNEVESLTCVSSELVPSGSVFVKTQPIVQIEDFCDKYYFYSSDYDMIAVGSRKSTVEIPLGNTKVISPIFYGQFIIGDILYFHGERFQIQKNEASWQLLHISDSPEEPQKLFLPYNEVLHVPTSVKCDTHDLYGKWICWETGNRLYLDEGRCSFVSPKGGDFTSENWHIENNMVMADNITVFTILISNYEIQLTSEDPCSTYVRVDPYPAWIE